MGRHRIITATALSLSLATIGAACGDDGADVRNVGECDGSGSASASGGSRSGSGSASASGPASASCPSGSGSGSGSETGSGSEGASGSGIAGEVAGSSTDDPLMAEAVAEYQAWVGEQVDQTIADPRIFTAAVRAGDLEGTKAA